MRGDSSLRIKFNETSRSHVVDREGYGCSWRLKIDRRRDYVQMEEIGDWRLRDEEKIKRKELHSHDCPFNLFSHSCFETNHNNSTLNFPLSSFTLLCIASLWQLQFDTGLRWEAFNIKHNVSNCHRVFKATTSALNAFMLCAAFIYNFPIVLQVKIRSR